MFKIEVNFDESALEREVKKQAQSAIDDIAHGMTRDFDRLRQQYGGQPVEVIKPAVKRVFEKDGGNISEPELTEYAQMISKGTKIEFKPDSLKL
jgi:hypothetical protein